MTYLPKFFLSFSFISHVALSLLCIKKHYAFIDVGLISLLLLSSLYLSHWRVIIKNCNQCLVSKDFGSPKINALKDALRMSSKLVLEHGDNHCWFAEMQDGFNHMA